MVFAKIIGRSNLICSNWGVFFSFLLKKETIMNMRMKPLIYASVIASAPLFAGTVAAQDATAEPTLWGIYGEHDKHDCPVNNIETAKFVIAS